MAAPRTNGGQWLAVGQKALFFVMVAIGSAIGPGDNGDAAQRQLFRPGLSCGDGGGLPSR